MVKEKYLGRLHIKIRTEKNLPYDLVSAFEFRYHDLDLPFEGLPFDRGAEKGHLLSIDFNGIPDEHILPEIMNVYGSFLFFGTTGPFFRVMGCRYIAARHHHATCSRH